MNLTYVVVLMAALVLFIMMGKNPFEHPPGYVPPDEFKDGIKEKIQTPQFGTPLAAGDGVGSFGVESPNPAAGSGNFGKNYGFGGAATEPPAERPSNLPVFQYQQEPKKRDDLPGPFQNLPNMQDDEQKGFGNPGSFGSGANNIFQSPHTPNIKTTDGKPVAFSGSAVVTLNKNGNVMAMPDGEHYLSNGLKIYVKDGKSMFPKDANEFF